MLAHHQANQVVLTKNLVGCRATKLMGKICPGENQILFVEKSKSRENLLLGKSKIGCPLFPTVAAVGGGTSNGYCLVGPRSDTLLLSHSPPFLSLFTMFSFSNLIHSFFSHSPAISFRQTFHFQSDITLMFPFSHSPDPASPILILSPPLPCLQNTNSLY